jgi:hypothetical protein
MSEPVMALRYSWRFFHLEDGVELGSAVEGVRLRLKGHPGKQLQSLLETLAQGVPVSSTLEVLSTKSGLSPSQVQEVIDVLQERHALITLEGPTTSGYRDIPFDRQIRFFNMFESNGSSGKDFNERLQNRKVVIVGVGGIGCWIALLCSRIGIRNIVAIDPDRVELSNLDRQVLYNRDDIGCFKVAACERALTRFGSNSKFEGHTSKVENEEDLSQFAGSADLVFNPFGYRPLEQALDYPVGKIARAALKAGIPSLISGGPWTGPLTVPGKTACYWCFLAQHEEANASLKWAVGPSRRDGTVGQFAPRLVISAAHAVWEAARYLSGWIPAATLESVIVTDFFNYDKNAILGTSRKENCQMCSSIRQDG